MTYDIPAMGKSFEDECDAVDYLTCVSGDYCDRLMKLVRQDIIDKIPEEDRAGYELAYDFILDALEYTDSGIQVGDMAAEELLESYIEEVDE